MCENIRILPHPPASMLVYEATVRQMFHSSGQVKDLLLGRCAGVCDGTGKIEVRIGGDLVF